MRANGSVRGDRHPHRSHHRLRLEHHLPVVEADHEVPECYEFQISVVIPRSGRFPMKGRTVGLHDHATGNHEIDAPDSSELDLERVGETEPSQLEAEQRLENRFAS